MAQLFDEAELLERIDHDWEFLGETVEMLAADGPALIREVRQAMDASDAAALGRVAHTLKGMAARACGAMNCRPSTVDCEHGESANHLRVPELRLPVDPVARAVPGLPGVEYAGRGTPGGVAGR